MAASRDERLREIVVTGGGGLWGSLAGLTTLLCLAWPVAAAEVLQVHSSIAPVQYLVQQVGGAHVATEVLVAAGQSPETYEPSPRQLARLAQADAFLAVGLPLESAWRRQLGGTVTVEWIDLAAPVPAGAPDATDPHRWLSPPQAQEMVTTIAGVLARLDPAHADRYRANAAALRARLAALHEEIGELLAASGVRAFLVYHPAWGHFAAAYGLQQIAIESEGKAPGSRGLVAVIERARASGIGTVFIDPRHSDRLARTVADALGARLVTLDPLAADYPANLRRAAHAIAASGS